MPKRAARMIVGVVLAVVVVSISAPPAYGAAAPPWTRPVPGALVRPYIAPLSRYGAGHRGVDFAAEPGTPVHAAGPGTVVFAGIVAGTRHVVIRHDNGWRTSYSYLAAVRVRAGQRVREGAIVGTTGGRGWNHDGHVLHLALRIGDRYVDPMQLFGPTDLAAIVHLAELPPTAAAARRGQGSSASAIRSRPAALLRIPATPGDPGSLCVRPGRDPGANRLG